MVYFRELKGEKPIEYDNQRWLYVHDIKEGKNTYLHLNCDCQVDEEGYCLLCGCPSPIVIK